MDSIYVAIESLDGALCHLETMIWVLAVCACTYWMYLQYKRKFTKKQALPTLRARGRTPVPAPQRKPQRIPSLESLSDVSTVDSDSELLERKSVQSILKQSSSNHTSSSNFAKSHRTQRQNKRVRFEIDGAVQGPLQDLANANAHKFLLEVGDRLGHPRLDVAKQTYEMLKSSNIRISAETYQLLVDIAIQGESLELATEISMDMEKQTGVGLSQDSLNRMLDLHVNSDHRDHCQTKKLDSDAADVLKNQLVAELRTHLEVVC